VINIELENKITQLINQKKATLINQPREFHGMPPKAFGKTNEGGGIVMGP
jgi:hypothetical protein